jgi:epoxyqueuosine reductase
MSRSITTEALRTLIQKHVDAYCESTGQQRIWRQPLLCTACVNERFKQLRSMVSWDHLLPNDLLPKAKAVIVFFLPFTKAIAVENHRGRRPAHSWAVAYEVTNRLIEVICQRFKEHLREAGFHSEVTPSTHNFDEKRLISCWSHKHVGYLAGLGRFGVNSQLITPSGCAGRLGSLVTDAPLKDSPLVHSQELCLYKQGKACLICKDRCPVSAVKIDGIDRPVCWQRLKTNLAVSETLAGRQITTHVCGKCQVVVPCSFKVPGRQDRLQG